MSIESQIKLMIPNLCHFNTKSILCCRTITNRVLFNQNCLFCYTTGFMLFKRLVYLFSGYFIFFNFCFCFLIGELFFQDPSTPSQLVITI